MTRYIKVALCIILIVSQAGPAQTTKSHSIPESIILGLLKANWSPRRGQELAELAPYLHPDDFYSQKNVPPDDAPIDDLVEYWSGNSVFRDWERNFKPSAIVTKRLVEFCQQHPPYVTRILPLFRESQDAKTRIKDLFDKEVSKQNVDKNWREYVHNWLKLNTDYYLDELTADAIKVTVRENDDDLKADVVALAKINWPDAEPILQNLVSMSQPENAYFALGIYYNHAIEINDSAGAEDYRRRLMVIVQDKNANATEAARVNTLNILMDTEWDGRDDWYLSLIKDKSDVQQRMVGDVARRNPGKWIPIFSKLLENEDRVTRNNTVNLLAQWLHCQGYGCKGGDLGRDDAIIALLPWLTNPDLADDADDSESPDKSDYLGIRGWEINNVGRLGMPEVAPALMSALGNSKRAAERAEAAEALGNYKDPSAVPALRAALKTETNLAYREKYLEALVRCGGLSDEEIIGYLEQYALFRITRGKNAKDDDEDPSPVTLSQGIGSYVMQWVDDPSDTLKSKIEERARILHPGKPALAAELLSLAQCWMDGENGSNRPVAVARRIISGKISLMDLKIALYVNDRDLREHAPREVLSMVNMNGFAKGIGLVILNDKSKIESELDGADVEAQAALLASARIVSLRLPLAKVGRLLHSKNKTLSLAAEGYLKLVNNDEAQKLLQAQH